MDLHLAGKSVIVMAASKGLGRATAELFVEEGAKVVITSRNVEELEKKQQLRLNKESCRLRSIIMFVMSRK